MIELRDITFAYNLAKVPALRDLSLTIARGEIAGVIGRAGAGKSTLCALCAGFVPNFYQGVITGSASVDGVDVVTSSVADLVRHVALVGSTAFSQISGARFTVFDEVGFALEQLGVPRAEMIERINWSLDVMQIGHLRDRSPYALSGGQQQRMVIAAALALRPPVLVLDEPTAQLDPLAIEELAVLLSELAAGGTTILFAEHRLEWAAGLAHRIVVLDEGSILADGEPRATLTDPRLLERNVGWPRPARMAEYARSAGLWPATVPLPATLEQLVRALSTVQPMSSPEPDRPMPSALCAAPEAPGHSTDSPAEREIEHVSLTYPGGVEALRDVSLTIGAGERIALLGRNGAGKSTLVRHLNGLLRPSSGRALVHGTDTHTTTVAQCSRYVGIVFQDIRNQLFARSVRDELRFGPRNLGFHPNRIEQLVDQALESLRLTDAAEMHPYDLPAPRRRLVAVAAVLAMDVDVLVLDEPTAGLDSAGIEILAQLLYEWAARGKSAIVVSHDIDFCFENLTRVILVAGGEFVLDSATASLDGRELAVLAENVGLPIGLQAARALGVPDGGPLARALQQRPEPLPRASAEARMG
jgi:energy-coupling factor transport system ATP-binding protein